MSCLDAFCISYFEEREEYSCMRKKGLELNKADFAVNGYEVDEVKYPRHGPKEPSLSSKKKMKMDNTLTIDMSKEESNDEDDNDDGVQLGQENTKFQPVSLNTSNDKEEEAHLEGQSIPLIGSKLGSVSVSKEKNEDLARARLQATPRKLFVSISQLSPSDPRRESWPLFSSPLPLLNLPNTRRSNVLLKIKTGAGRQLCTTRICQC